MNWLDARVINSVPMSSSTVAVIAYSHISRELSVKKPNLDNICSGLKSKGCPKINVLSNCFLYYYFKMHTVHTYIY